jgi:hypothetical protein
MSSVNLNRINDYPGTGELNDTAQPWTIKPYKEYGTLILKIFVGFVVFGWTTATHYCNTMSIDAAKDYPYDDAALNELSKQNKNPYCSSLVECGYINDVSKDNDKIMSIARWFQITQESSYEIGGKMLNKFFGFSKYLLGEHTANVQTSFSTSSKAPSTKNVKMKASDTGFLGFLIWFVFGLFTQASITLMVALLSLMWIPGWIGGLLAFMPITYTIQSTFLKIICKIAVFIGSMILMCTVGMITVFPVIYEFGYLFYLFFMKQLFSEDPNKVGNEFMSRMKHLIIVFVIVALIVAAVQLPPVAAGIMTGIVLATSGISYYLSHNDDPAPSSKHSKTD